jgi:branched-subunit amino acid ABC-type transport system permease component
VTELLQRTLDGLLESGPYALVGLGLTLSFGVLRRVNLAYGAGAMLAAYAGSWLYSRHDWPGVAVLLFVLAATVAIGLYVEWICFAGLDAGAGTPGRGGAPVSGADGREVVALASSFAVWMQLEQLSVNLLPRHLNPFPYLASTGEWAWGPLMLRADRLLQFGAAVALVLALRQWLERSRTGLALRAVSDQRTAAHLVGLRVRWVQRLAFALACALAGLAACAVLALDGQVTPMFGMWMLVKGLVAAMLGGLGSVRGVLLGAVALGVAEAHAQALFGALGRDATAWALLLAALLWRGAAGVPGLVLPGGGCRA